MVFCGTDASLASSEKNFSHGFSTDGFNSLHIVLPPHVMQFEIKLFASFCLMINLFGHFVN